MAPLNWRTVGVDVLLAAGTQALQKIISYVAVVLLARYLQKDDIGAFFFAASLASIVALVGEFGTTRYLTRRVAAEPESATGALGEVLIVRIPLMAASFVAMSVVVAVFYSSIWLTVALSMLYVLLRSLFQSFTAVFLALRRIGYRVVPDIASQLVLILLLWLAIRRQDALNVVLVNYVIANVVLVGAAAYFVLARIGAIRLSWDVGAWKAILHGSFPFVVLTVLSVLHFKVDSLMLGVLVSMQAVADYEIAYKFLEVSRVVVRPIGMIFFPICAALASQNDWTLFRSVALKLIGGTAIVAIVLGVVVMTGASRVIQTVFGSGYAPSVPILQILFASLPAVYLAFVGVVLANSLHLEKTLIRVMMACLIVNVVANLYAIPRWHGLGAAWTTFATEMLLAIGVLVLMLRRLAHVERISAAAAAPDYEFMEETD